MLKLRLGRSRVLTAAMVGCLVPLFMMSDSGAAPGTVATAIRVDSVAHPLITPPTTLDTPSIWIAAGTDFTITAKSVDGTGPAPLSFTKDISVKITAVSSLGTVQLGTVVVPKGTSDIVLPRARLTADIDDAKIHLESVEKRGDVRSGDSATFDVQSDFINDLQGDDLDIAIGGTVSTDGKNCTPNTESKICYEIHFPANSTDSSHLLSLGNCNNTINLCRANLDYWWSLVNIDQTVVNRFNPVITDMGLDKSLKGIAFEHGVPKARWTFRPSGSEVWDTDVPNCPSRGVIAEGDTYCQDTTESHRDNSGDTWIRLLWLQDARGSLA